MLDVRARAIRLEFEIEKVTSDNAGKQTVEVVAHPTHIMLNNEPSVVVARGGSYDFEIAAKGHVNADTSISLFCTAQLSQGGHSLEFQGGPSIRMNRTIADWKASVFWRHDRFPGSTGASRQLNGINHSRKWDHSLPSRYT